MKDVQIQVLLNILDEVTQRYDEIFEIKERLLREANYKSTHDLLTNLYNRSYFEAKVKTLIRKKEPFALAFMDLDNFKFVNDTYGHKVGDEVLIQVSEILKKNLKGGDIIARFGGDEFLIAIKECSKEDAFKLFQEIINEIKKVLRIYHLTASVGISYYPEIKEYKELLKTADEKMYEAKRKGKDRIVF
ncbi:MAG: GGDEF domain-containing protein [Nautiliaceae bacterium]